MTTAVQRRRGTTTEHATFTGLEGEISVNTTKDTLVVHDGSTAGGFELMRADGSNSSVSLGDITGVTAGTGLSGGGTSGDVTLNIDSTVATLAGTQTFTNKTLTSPILNTPTIGTSFTIGGATITEAELEILDGATLTTTELNYVDGVTSSIQTQLDAKAPLASPTFTGTVTIPTADINAGSIDGTTIGASSASTGAFTTLTATGLDVTGTVTASAATPSFILSETDRTDENTQLLNASGDFRIRTRSDDGATNTDRFRIDHATGDISFYEDTGTTPKLFWDASAESLGIGTSSPDKLLDVSSNSAPTIRISNTRSDSSWDTDPVFGALEFYSSDASGSGPSVRASVKAEAFTAFGNATDLVFRNGDSQGVQQENLRIDYLGRVGIGTSSPATELEVNGDIGIGRAVGGYTFRETVGGGERASIKSNSSNELLFSIGAASEAMRIDSSGNLLVGKTASNSGTAGHELLDYGRAVHTVTASTVQILNRLGNDGTILLFEKDGSNVGSIGSRGGTDSYILLGGAGITGSGTGGGAILPTTGANTYTDNVVDLGFSSGRFDDIYATNGTIQTSDRNEKQDIAELSEAEQRVAVAAKGLLRKFRWKDSVAEKGDDARIHFGIIAQDLQAAFEAEGLDAGDYAMFISTTWTDEETNEEKTRMGVRYSELLAFIISAI